MGIDDRSRDDRLRQTAHATLIRFEDDVDGEAAMTEFRRRVNVAEVPDNGSARRDRQRGTRRVWAVAAATTLVVGGIAALAWPDNSSQLATTSPDPIDTTAGSTPSTESPASSPATTTETATTSAQPSSAPRELVDLFGHTWVITAVDGHPRPFVAHFEMSAGRITGHDGCNRYGATFQVNAIVDGETSIELSEVESTAMGCLGFDDEEWWSAPNGRYRVDDNELTITATDGRIFSAVDLEALEMINSPEQIVGVWTVRSGASIEFADDGTIRLACAALGTWTFDPGLRTEIDETADTSRCGDLGPESLGPTYEALVSTSPVIRILADGSLLVESSAYGRLFPSSSGEVATIDSELGRVSYTLPPGSTADPRPANPLPDFAVGQARWIVPDCCNLTVTLQNLEPPMPDWEMTDSFEANGVQWNLYDSGPRDGTLIIARGTAGPITVLVATQGLGGDPPRPSTLPVAQAVVRTVVVDPNGAS